MWVVRAIARKSDGSGWRGGLLIAAVFAMAALLAGASWSAFQSARDRDAAEAWRLHTLQVLLVTDRMKIATLQAMRGERGYLLTGDRAYLGPFVTGAADARRDSTQLADLTRDNPGQQQRALEVAAKTEDFLVRMQQIAELERYGHHTRAVDRVRSGEGRRAIEGIHTVLAAMEKTERELLASRDAIAQSRAQANEFYQYFLSLVGVVLLAVSVLATIAVRRAVVAERSVRRELRKLAMFDELTGLANRREFFAGLEREIAAATRTGRPLAVAMLDIDHFKCVNDSWGHAAGDAVIRRVAEIAMETMRGHDLVGRLGGEEFAIVMPGASAQDAIAAGERLRRRIARERVQCDGELVVSVTASTGIARFLGGESAEQLLARADEALYDAKNAGRDRVLLAA